MKNINNSNRKSTRIGSLLVLGLGLFISIFTANVPAKADLSAIDLNFEYKAKGVIVVKYTLDEKPNRHCIERLRAAVSFEGDEVSARDRKVFSQVIQNRKKKRTIKLKGLPGMRARDGKDPILSLQVQYGCGKRGDDSAQITSQPVARFLVCGEGTKLVSPRNFLNELRFLGQRVN